MMPTDTTLDPKKHRGLLSGVRVLDLSRILAGPWASQTLADMGADVVKVEQKGLGDDTRRWGPPFIKDHNQSAVAGYFLACNRGKRSIALDFKNPDELALLKQLATKADVVIENFKVGALRQYGLDYLSLSHNHSSLVYCSITGFGQTGADASLAGYDAMIQARGGLMSITGEENGAPVKVGVAVTDLMTGMYAATAICAALYRKNVSGQGEYIDLALLDTQVAMLANQAQNYLLSGHVPQKLGSAHPNIVPYQVMPASDGDFMLAVGNDEQFRRCCVVLGLPDLAEHKDYQTNASRVQHRETLIRLLSAQTQKHPRAHWQKALAQTGVPFGPVQTIDEVMSDPQVIAREMIQDVSLDSSTRYKHIASPIKLTHHTIENQRAAPNLGADHQSILDDWLGDKNAVG